jgi:hypothetical protein
MNPPANGSSGPVTRTRDGSLIKTLLSIVKRTSVSQRAPDYADTSNSQHRYLRRLLL